MLASTLVLGACLAAAAPEPPIVLNGKKQLFLDDFLIASMNNVKRQVHPARKHPRNPIMGPTEPWEGNVVYAGSVIQDGSRYRMWYGGNPGVAYAESTDGLRWTKPVFDFFKADGRKTNGLLQIFGNAAQDEKAKADYAAGVPNVIPFFRTPHNVIKDPRDPDASRRYKMPYLSVDYMATVRRRGTGVAASPDGIHWTMSKDWVTDSVNDGSYVMRDPQRDKYVMYGRTNYHSPEVLAAWGQDEYFKKNNPGRAVTRLESADLLTWDYTEWQKSPITLCADTRDPTGSEIYSMIVFPYESVYIGLPQMFYNQEKGTLLEIQLSVSRDGVHFERVGNRGAFIPCGEIGEWDRFNNTPFQNPPLEMGDELWFYYSGRTYRHGPYSGPDYGMAHERGIVRSQIGLATIKRDRFVSLGASFDRGVIVTKPVRLAGKRLHLNAKANYGEILVEVLGPGETVSAKSKWLIGDSLDLPVEWETGNLDAVSEPVSLRITLRNALLFALWCT
jgi:hypothetical protein